MGPRSRVGGRADQTQNPPVSGVAVARGFRERSSIAGLRPFRRGSDGQRDGPAGGVEQLADVIESLRV